MKKNILARIMIVIIAIAVVLPTFIERIQQEHKNKSVVTALNYNDFEVKLSGDEFDASLKKFKRLGVNTVLIEEESVSSLIATGYITGIKYNVLSHKYDDESEEILKILEKDPNIHNDSYVLISKREECREYLELWLPTKYESDEYTKLTTATNADVFVIYEGAAEAWQVTTGFIPSKIEKAKKYGMEVALSMSIGNYTTTKYVDLIDSMVREYDIKYISLKNDYRQKELDNFGYYRNYNAICRLIRNNNLVLVVNENQDQLSNERPKGYDALVESANGRVLRGYTAMDYATADETGYKFRYYQMLNSVIDRNIRFINVKLLINGTDTFASRAQRTYNAVEDFYESMEEFGYNVKSFDTKLDGYDVNLRINALFAMYVMLVMALTMIEWVMGRKYKYLGSLFVVAGIAGTAFTLVVNKSVIELYSSLFAIIAPCFAVTILLKTIERKKDEMGTVKLIFLCSALSLGTLALCGIIQSALLGGLDYYINTIIFRGIKLSLIVPVLYAAVAFGLMFGREYIPNLLKKIPRFIDSEIKVSWVLIAAAIGAVGFIYIRRSGNVSKILSIEAWMRNLITENMAARPRTKEFLVGWPCLVLFIYYMKNVNFKFAQWVLAMGASILFASVINSFCHVFTAVGTIYMRVLNGLWIGAIFSIAAYFANLLFLRLLRIAVEKAKQIFF